MEMQLVIFELSGEQFGIDIAVIESIVKIPPIVKLPQSLDYVMGVTNIRGDLLPVIDLKKRLGFDVNSQGKNTRVIIVTKDGNKYGMLVDSVSEVLMIDDAVIEPTPPMVTNVRSDFVVGIAKADQRLVILLNLSKVLNTEENKEQLMLSG